MSVRRFVYDEAAGAVVEVGAVRGSGLSATEAYREARGQYEYDSQRKPSDGSALRAAALERANRREFANRKYGDERRWAE